MTWNPWYWGIYDYCSSVFFHPDFVWKLEHIEAKTHESPEHIENAEKTKTEVLWTWLCIHLFRVGEYGEDNRNVSVRAWAWAHICNRLKHPLTRFWPYLNTHIHMDHHQACITLMICSIHTHIVQQHSVYKVHFVCFQSYSTCFTSQIVICLYRR